MPSIHIAIRLTRRTFSTWIRSGVHARSRPPPARACSIHCALPQRYTSRSATSGTRCTQRLDVVRGAPPTPAASCRGPDARTRHRHDPRTALGRQRGQLVPEQDIRRRVDPVDQDHVARSLRQSLEERAHRGDPDARRHEQHLVAGPDSGVQPAVRSLDEDPRAGWSPSRPVEPSPTWTAVIRSRDPSGAADSENGWARVHPGRSRKRHRRYCPARAPQPVEVASRHDDRRHAQRLAADLVDHEPVAMRPDQREGHAGTPRRSRARPHTASTRTPWRRGCRRSPARSRAGAAGRARPRGRRRGAVGARSRNEAARGPSGST